MRKRNVWAIALLILVGAGISSTSAVELNSQVQLPVQSVTIALKEATRSDFFDALRKFAEMNGFTIEIAPTRPDIPRFVIQMEREDLEIIGGNAFTDWEFDISFYAKGSASIDKAIVDRLMLALKEVVSNIRGAAIVQ